MYITPSRIIKIIYFNSLLRFTMTDFEAAANLGVSETIEKLASKNNLVFRRPIHLCTD